VFPLEAVHSLLMKRPVGCSYFLPLGAVRVWVRVVVLVAKLCLKRMGMLRLRDVYEERVRNLVRERNIVQGVTEDTYSALRGTTCLRVRTCLALEECGRASPANGRLRDARQDMVDYLLHQCIL